ncbi:NAD(P)-binding protein [Linderina pennispora]|uniref:NAD(P)-binding protein n=1 Tax=Linderina pennispora TaxID=61395 RepID=A0A1Y1VWZ9_9FUNG|nr:NAD(P)-binding protein [Linderina pennispora]ORX65802.1 NAD(P)-binding protein [Linderina pennispora]
MPVATETANKVVLITGGNSGTTTIVLACRNLAKATGGSRVVQLDTSSIASVQQAAKEILGRFTRLDLLCCNAGAMPIDKFNVAAVLKSLATDPARFFESSVAFDQKRGLVTGDGLGTTFATNVFGHYLLIHKLLDLLSQSRARVVWTGSAANSLQFSRADYQHVHGAMPYESSKYIVDQIVQPLDERLALRNVRCFVVEPGNVCSAFLSSYNMPFFEALVFVFFVLVRVVVGMERLTISPENGCDELDARIKYYSCASRLGRPFVDMKPIKYDKDVGRFLIGKLDKLVEKYDK